MSTRIPPGQEFRDLFDRFDHTAFRLESRDSYSAPKEHEGLRRFLAGERDHDLFWSTDIARSWIDMLQGVTAAGKLFRRVRVVSLPLSDYSRYGLWSSERNNRAGEDIRYLDRATAERLGLPNEDYWLFDSHCSARLHFDESDRLLEVELVDDPAELVAHNHWRDIAWHHAVRREDFAAEHDLE